jgi:hypothetical protein
MLRIVFTALRLAGFRLFSQLFVSGAWILERSTFRFSVNPNPNVETAMLRTDFLFDIDTKSEADALAQVRRRSLER